MTAPDHESGGQGGADRNGDQTTDGRLIEQAIRRWPLTREHRAALVEKAMEILTAENTSQRGKLAAMRAVLAAEAQNQADEHRDKPVQLEHSGEIKVTIEEQADWYGDAHHRSAAIAASGGSAAGPGAVQGAGVRAAVGQNGNGAAGNGQGPRAH